MLSCLVCASAMCMNMDFIVLLGYINVLLCTRAHVRRICRNQTNDVYFWYACQVEELAPDEPSDAPGSLGSKLNDLGKELLAVSAVLMNAYAHEYMDTCDEWATFGRLQIYQCVIQPV